jgi:phosphoesterase RecJ-like protein
LISHAKPDGDALGSLLALRALLRGRGADAEALLFEKAPSRYAFMAAPGYLTVGGGPDDPAASALFESADGVVILDTCSYSQLEPVASWLRTTPLPKFVIDHHATGDPITDRVLIDVSAPATCSLLYELAVFAGWPIGREAAGSLLIGIATDTGWFRHSNTDGRALRAAAELSACGVRPHELYEALFLQDSVGRVRLLGVALDSLELHAGDQLAITALSRDAFRRAGAAPSDTEDIVNEPLRIASVVVSVLIVEQDDGEIRINFRSKAPESTSHRPDVDVAAMARQFGGGGHHRAAGARCKTPVEDLRRVLVERLVRLLAP